MKRLHFVIMAALLLIVALAALPVSALPASYGSGNVPSVAAPGYESSYVNFTNWLPTIFAALLLAISLVSLYYMIGVALNNLRVKGMAISEFWQVLGTAVMVVAILWIFSVFGATLTSTRTLVVSPTAISKICNNPTLTKSQFDFANSGLNAFQGENSSTTIQSPTYIVCSEIIETAAQNNDPTSNLDYGLAAAYVISANMTNQTLANLDALYFFEGTAGWLRTFQSITTLCIGGNQFEIAAEEFNAGLGAANCANPLEPDKLFQIQYKYQPFQAYYFQRLALPPVEITASLIFYVFFLQMTGSLIMLYWWPFLLAAGILLRTFSITRRAGGLIIALVVVSVIVYPIMYLFEYTSLSNSNQLCQYNNQGLTSILVPAPAGVAQPSLDNCVQIIGVNSLPNMAIDELPLQYTGPYAGPPINSAAPPNPDQTAVQYQLNFFNFPNLAWVLNYYGCYPIDSNLFAWELEYASNYLVPLAGAANGVKGGVLGLFAFFFGSFNNNVVDTTVPQLNIFGNWSCFDPQNYSVATEAIFNVYGVMSVTGFIIPLMNILIALSAIVGLSGMLGGDTNIIGLARFV